MTRIVRADCVRYIAETILDAQNRQQNPGRSIDWHKCIFYQFRSEIPIYTLTHQSLNLYTSIVAKRDVSLKSNSVALDEISRIISIHNVCKTTCLGLQC